MGNPLPSKIKIGTIGELFIQLKLLEFGVQSAPPIKDSGNDLIAIKGEVVKFIQVKTTTNNRWNLNKLPLIYHLVALVELKKHNGNILFDKSKIFVFKKGETRNDKRELSKKIVDEIWLD